MRYLIDREYRPRKQEKSQAPSHGYASELRRELSARNQQWALQQGFLHEVSLGHIPAVLYREDERGRHGNFMDASYRAICANIAWKRRLQKVHSTAKRGLLSRDPDRCELDSSNSSDALLMNIFCHPETPGNRAVCQLVNISQGAQPAFGYKPRIPMRNNRRDCTEVDLKLDDLLIEAKLTEFDFQQAPRRLLERYPRFAEIFDEDPADLSRETIESYQLIRGALAADAHAEHRFCVLCDARRPDLIARWHGVLRRVKPHDLRCRLVLLTWQELAAVLPIESSDYLAVKYGIVPA